jgi:hypothetical protein
MRIFHPQRSPAFRLLTLLLIFFLLAPPALTPALLSSPVKDPPAFITRDDLPEKGEDEKKEEEKLRSKMGFGFKTGDSYYQQGTPPTTDAGEHGHVKLSPAEMASRQKAVADFLQGRQGPLTKNDRDLSSCGRLPCNSRNARHGNFPRPEPADRTAAPADPE